MVDKIVQGSIAARAVKSLLGLFAASMENSFIANRLPLFFKSIGSIKIRYAGLVIFIITILRLPFFLQPQLAGTIDCRPFLYALIAVSLLFSTSPLKITDVLSNSFIRKILK